MIPSAERFANRADNYTKYRPGYPLSIIPFLQEKIGLSGSWRIADIGAGTGIFSELLLKEGCEVVAVEPNAEMREKANHLLNQYPAFSLLDGSADKTGLETNSIDLIAVAQAFHWMEPVPTKQEFARILKPGGHILLLWNIRRDDSPFLRAYEGLRRKYGGNYHTQRNEVTDASLQAFFAPAPMTTHLIKHSQWLDYTAFEGLFLSSSFIPVDDETLCNNMLADLRQLFTNYEKDGLIEMEYEAKLYLG